ncbi:MAG: hypothetical protein LBG64_03225 [Pseudomonadales bacterium]|jgi:hypothetical protein|nr:hypothetical protein [Pseudomonadales bacterium]
MKKVIYIFILSILVFVGGVSIGAIGVGAQAQWQQEFTISDNMIGFGLWAPPAWSTQLATNHVFFTNQTGLDKFLAGEEVDDSLLVRCWETIGDDRKDFHYLIWHEATHQEFDDYDFSYLVEFSRYGVVSDRAIVDGNYYKHNFTANGSFVAMVETITSASWQSRFHCPFSVNLTHENVEVTPKVKIFNQTASGSAILRDVDDSNFILENVLYENGYGFNLQLVDSVLTYQLEDDEKYFWTVSFDYQINNQEVLRSIGSYLVVLEMCGQQVWHLNLSDYYTDRSQTVFIPRNICNTSIEQLVWRRPNTHLSNVEVIISNLSFAKPLLSGDEKLFLELENHSLSYTHGQQVQATANSLLPIELSHQPIEFIIRDQRNMETRIPFIYQRVEGVSSNIGIKYSSKENQNSVTLKIESARNGFFSKYDLRLARSARDLVNNFSQQISINLPQLHSPFHVGRHHVQSMVTEVLVSESIDDSEYFLALKKTSGLGSYSQLKEILHCNNNNCVAQEVNFEKITITNLNYDDQLLYVTFKNLTNYPLDLNNWFFGENQHHGEIISSLNHHFGQTSLGVGEELRLFFVIDNPNLSSLQLWDERGNLYLSLKLTYLEKYNHYYFVATYAN